MMQGKVRVLVRIRPGKDTPAAIGKEDELTVAYKRAEESELRRLTFDGVLGAKVDQTGVYARVAPLVQGALDGYNCCLVAYGQTGAGKTHSLFGTDNQPGVAPRAIEQLFGEAAGQGGSTTYRFRVTILEIYGNSLVDLLRVSKCLIPLHLSLPCSGHPLGSFFRLSKASMPSPLSVHSAYFLPYFPNSLPLSGLTASMQ